MRPTRRGARSLAIVVAAGAALLPPAALRAQVRASERALVRQTIDGTVLTIEYSRPRSRGRELFGKTVPWGEVWTPGANWATTLEVSRDVRLDGHPVPKGKYSMWFVVRPEAWTMILDPRFNRYHEDRPDSTAEQIRWTVRPTRDARSEDMLTWTFPQVRPDGGTLGFAWGTTRVALDAAVTPSRPLTIDRAAIVPYLGTYDMELTYGDTVVHDRETVELYYEDGSLKHRYARIPPWYKLLQRTTLVRINDDWFIPVIMKDGKVWEMAADFIFEFDVKDGRAVSFEVRDDQDVLLGKGTRRP